MKQLISIFIFAALFVSLAEAKPKKPKKGAATVAAVVVKDTIEFKTKADTVSYFIGMQIGADMVKNGATDINSIALEKGLSDALNSKAPKIDPQLAMMYAQAYFTEKQAIKKQKKMQKQKLSSMRSLQIQQLKQRLAV